MDDCVAVRTHTEIVIPWSQLDGAFLSVPCWRAIASGYGLLRHGPKGVASGERTYEYPRYCPTYEEHAANIPVENDQALLICGARNLGNNLGFVAFRQDGRPEVLHLADEPYDKKLYTCLCWVEENGHRQLVLENATFPNEHRIRLPEHTRARVHWAASGQAILWDGEVPPLAQFVGETYDLRHVFHLVDNERLAKTDEDKEHIRQDILSLDRLRRLYTQNQDLSPAERGHMILSAAEDMGLTRQHGYLHSSIGISPQGVILLMAHGAIEEIGRAQQIAGAERAILLDNGGSCGYYLSSLATKFFTTSTYFRPHAISALAFRLKGQLLERPFQPRCSQRAGRAPIGVARNGTRRSGPQTH